MKTDTHPDYTFVTVKLADGTEYTTRSTMAAERYAAEIDSSNHPFYTGKKTMVDTAGRVERFRRRYGNAHATQMTATEDAQAAEDATADAERAAEEASAAQAVSASAPAPETQTAEGEQDGAPVPGTGKPPASSPDNPARDTEKTDRPLPATED